MIALQETMQADRMAKVADHVTRETPDVEGNAMHQIDEHTSSGGLTSGARNTADLKVQQSTVDGDAMSDIHIQGSVVSLRTRQLKPCKGMRARYRKLVDRLLQQVRRDPGGVAYDEIQAQLPPSVADNEWLKNKLIGRLRQEQARLLQSGYCLR